MKKIQVWANAEMVAINQRVELYFTEKMAEYEGDLLDARHAFKKYLLATDMYQLKRTFNEIKHTKEQILTLVEMKAYLDSDEDIEVEQKIAA